MNKPESTSYDQFAQVLATRGVDAALDWLAREFRQNNKYAEWFEVLKMQARRQVGLDLVRTSDETSEGAAQLELLEPLLYKACGQVGEKLFRDGQPGLAWKYFQLVGDRPRAAELLRAIPASHSNVNELIDVAIGGGVAPEYGIELTLKFLGTCNAITSIDQHAAYLPSATRGDVARLLTHHLYRELIANIATHIERNEGRAPNAGSLAELIEERPWLFADDAYHIDASHLAATVRIARMATDRATLEQAHSLCAYGRRLNSSLVGSGDPPFEDLFVAHEKYFAAALHQGVEQALQYFAHRLPTARDPEKPPEPAAEVMVDLLCRNQRWSEALRVSLDWLDGADGFGGIVPAALEIARQAGQFDELAQWYRAHDNLLMFTIASLKSRAD